MKKSLIPVLAILVLMTLACGATVQSVPLETATSAPTKPTSTFTPIPTFTSVPTATSNPEKVIFDFAAEVCNAKWMNGGQELKACPDPNADHSAGYASLIDPTSVGLAANTSVMLTFPAWNGFGALFLRYPALTVRAGDHFRAMFGCQTACHVSFALEYYDSAGKYHSSLVSWEYVGGEPQINAEYDLSELAGQTLEFVLALRPVGDTPPQEDAALWIAPRIVQP